MLISNTIADLALTTEQDILAYSGTSSAGVGDIVCESSFQAALGNVSGASGNGLTDGDLPFVQGCAPLNLFGEGVRSEVAREWVTADGTTNTDIEQSVFNVNFGGDLLEMPGGWMAFNVGYENRREFAVFAPGSGTEIPISRSSPFAETGGEYETDEFYGEVVIPLVSSDMNWSFLEFAELNGAYRQIDNSLAGDQDVWTIGMRIAPVGGLTFRGNYTEAIRAPSLVELFAPQNQSFGFANDPCDFRFVQDGPVPQTRLSNCTVSIAGYDPATFTSNIVNATAIGKTGGNPNLTNELSESYALGLTFESSGIDNLLFTADYINIELSDAIQVLGFSQLMVSCHDSTDFPNVSSCDSFVRDGAGQVVDFTTGQVNAALFTFESVQLGLEYNFEVSSLLGGMSDALGGRSLGNFETRIRMDHPLERDISVVGEATDNTVGGYADPSWSGTFDFIWSSENARIFWRTLWSARPYLDPTLNDVFATEDGGAVQKADARFMNNVTVSYNLDSFFPGAPETTMIQLGIGNVLNRKPDVIQEARGFYGTPELLGRNYTLTLQGNW